jgi:hypothetical protein
MRDVLLKILCTAKSHFPGCELWHFAMVLEIHTDAFKVSVINLISFILTTTTKLRL